MSLSTLVADSFIAGGLLMQKLEGFTPRQAQTDMALAVARTVEEGGSLVVEAGTGVGKTFAYLVPALLSGERVLLSTATKTLQDQLFARDLPRLLKALRVPVRTALLKGRASYLCQHRLTLARQDPQAAGAAHALGKIEKWSQATRTGDLAELPGLDERSPLIPLVTSTRDNCLGSTCPKFRDCHVNAARREAMAADVVVVNHHLFFADMAVRESGVAELLPTVRVVVFDEAHQLNDIGVQFLGCNLTTSQIIDLARDILAAGLQFARGLADWAGVVAELDRAARDLRLVVGKVSSAKLSWTGPAPQGVHPEDWDEACLGLRAACDDAVEALSAVSEVSPDFARLQTRVADVQANLVRFAGACAVDAVRWVEVSGRTQGMMRLVESPLDIAAPFSAKRMGAPSSFADVDLPLELHHLSPSPVPSPQGGEGVTAERPKAWIFTSATLGADEALTWFTEPCGLADAEILRVGSPFQYATQAALYIPSDLPEPADLRHSVAVAQLVAEAAPVLGGRTLVLTTTLKALQTIGETLHRQFEHSTELEVLVQGEWPKRRLMERFRQGKSDGQHGCILVASASFWEGFDVPGQALQLVVIDKLPFPPPNDPLVLARTQRLERQGRRAFNDYFVPEAAVSLKQGAGRLIRQETDAGVLILGDTRLLSKPYGKRILAALPDMRRLTSSDDLMQSLALLNTHQNLHQGL